MTGGRARTRQGDEGGGGGGQAQEEEKRREDGQGPGNRLPGLWHEPDHQHGDNREEDGVDEEDPAPAQGVHQDAAEDRTRQGKDGGGGGPGADGAAAGLPVPVERCKDCQRLGRQQGGPDPLDQPAGDEPFQAGCEATGGGRGGEEAHAEDEDPLAAEAVTQDTANDQEAGQGQGVARDDPLEAGQVALELPVDGWEGDAHGAAVHEDGG